jgi:excisionase family DNA binding protein
LDDCQFEPLAYSIETAAVVSDHSRTTLYRAISDGRLVARKSGGKTVILRSDLETFLYGLPVSRAAKIQRVA